MWGAVGLGLLGSCLVAFGGISAESSDMAATYPDEFRGVCLLLIASLAISMATIRLGTLGESVAHTIVTRGRYCSFFSERHYPRSKTHNYDREHNS